MRPGRKHRTSKTLGIVLVVGMIAAATYAFTATNTVAASQAGDGNATISGFDVSDVAYTPNAADPTLLTSYSFTLDGDASFVKAKAVSTQLTWDTCVEGLLNSWTCTAPVATTIESLDDLRVIAVQ